VGGKERKRLEARGETRRENRYIERSKGWVRENGRMRDGKEDIGEERRKDKEGRERERERQTKRGRYREKDERGKGR
jgi:hypothetical protein